MATKLHQEVWKVEHTLQSQYSAMQSYAKISWSLLKSSQICVQAEKDDEPGAALLDS